MFIPKYIFKEKAGVISKYPIWVCIDDNYMYTADTLPELFTILDTEFRHHKYLIG